MGKLGLAGVFPGGQPVGTDVSCGIGDLANEDSAGLVVEVVVVFVGVGVDAASRVAIGVENWFKPTV